MCDRIPLILIFVLPLAYATIVYEYGNDSPYSREVAHYQGEIGLLQKWTFVPVHVPPCYNLTYVLVKVENKVSLPTIKYNEKYKTVSIVYSLISDSRSSYSIQVKAIQICLGDQMNGQFDKLKQNFGSNVPYRPEVFNVGFEGRPEVVAMPAGNYQDDVKYDVTSRAVKFFSGPINSNVPYRGDENRLASWNPDMYPNSHKFGYSFSNPRQSHSNQGNQVVIHPFIPEGLYNQGPVLV